MHGLWQDGFGINVFHSTKAYCIFNEFFSLSMHDCLRGNCTLFETSKWFIFHPESLKKII